MSDLAHNSHNSGQMCLAGSRIFVQEDVYDEFLEGLVAAAQAIKQGDGFDPSVHQGSLISKAQLDVSLNLRTSWLPFTISTTQNTFVFNSHLYPSSL